MTLAASVSSLTFAGTTVLTATVSRQRRRSPTGTVTILGIGYNTAGYGDDLN